MQNALSKRQTADHWGKTYTVDYRRFKYIFVLFTSSSADLKQAYSG